MDARRLLEEDTRLKVAEVLARYRWQARMGEQGYSDAQFTEITRVLNVITVCRTGKLGSHLFICSDCQRTRLGLNKCNNRHCTTCGESRRNRWRSDVTQWSLACDYWHNVFTLPHEPNELMRANPREMYSMLLRCVRDTLVRRLGKKWDCQPGLVMTLHTWGQLMNAHVHVHVIMTAGGMSSDGQRWIPIPAGHPAMDEVSLASEFKQMLLRRLRYRLRRNALGWPEVDASEDVSDWSQSDLSDASGEAGLSAESQTGKLGRARQRELSEAEEQL
ncbi:MAG: transposase zinc-binding domain-containing protein, partial [Aureliella sp.]